MAKTNTGKRPLIDEQRCCSCARCLVVRACRNMAVLRLDPDEPPVIDSGRCKLCLACIAPCPFGAVILA